MPNKLRDNKKGVLTPAPRFHIEIDGTSKGTFFLVNGVIGISEFSSELIKLITRYGSLSLGGSSLGIALFEAGVIEISGNVESISLKYIKRGRRNAT